MQRMVLLAVLAVLTVLGGCAARDPNLTVRNLGEFGRSAGDYTLNVTLYDLDADGRAQLAAAGDESLRGFVARTLSAKGYALKASGPARYGVEVHLLCGNMRTADKGILGEELRIPASALGANYSAQVHYWVPEKGLAIRETQDLRDSMQNRRAVGGTDRASQNSLGGSPLGQQTPEVCQGRVLVVVAPQGTGPAREVFVGRAATDDCRAVSGCAVGVCRSALEQTLVDLLERRF